MWKIYATPDIKWYGSKKVKNNIISIKISCYSKC